MMNCKKIVLFILAVIVSGHSFAQKATTRTIDNITYAVISSEGMVKGFETRNSTTTGTNHLYYSTPLYTYSEKGLMPPPGAEDRDPAYSWPVYVNGSNGDIVQVQRVVRHSSYYGNGSYSFPGGTSQGIYSKYTPGSTISTLFAVAPTDIYDDGQTTSNGNNSPIMTWASAAGYLASANGNNIDVNSTATEKGCYMYRGVNGTDQYGTWRLPTLRELTMIWILRVPLVNTKEKTNFVDFLTGGFNGYWGVTESKSNATIFSFYKGVSQTITKVDKNRVRCVRDMLPPQETTK